ncbi:hypothetical protein Tco_0739521 [Tanacetum coccineum]
MAKPLDNALASACHYTKQSQELLVYVIGTCPKELNRMDNKAASTPLIRRKQVTFNNTCRMSINDTQKQVRPQKFHQSNVTVIPSTGVSSSTGASGSNPRSNTKHDRILPAKSVNKKKVEDHLRTNKSVWTKVNRVDSSISSKRVVINLNSKSVCKTWLFITYDRGESLKAPRTFVKKFHRDMSDSGNDHVGALLGLDG